MCEPIPTPERSDLETYGVEALLSLPPAARSRPSAEFSAGDSACYTVAEGESGRMQLAMDLKQRHSSRAYDAVGWATNARYDRVLGPVTGAEIILVPVAGQLCRAVGAEGLRAENPNDHATEGEIGRRSF